MARPSKHAALLAQRDHHAALAEAYTLVVQDLSSQGKRKQLTADTARMEARLRAGWAKRSTTKHKK